MEKRFLNTILAVFVVLNILLWRAVTDASRDDLHVQFFDIGQGDSIYIRTPANQDILIDGGPDNLVLSRLGQVMPYYDRKLELVILTHPHADHLDGLIDVFNRYKVDNVLYSGVEYGSASYQEWLRIIKDKNIEIRVAQTGQVIRLGSAQMTVFSPDGSLGTKNIDNLNNISVVTRLQYGQNRFMLTGDAEQEIEKLLLDRFPSDMLNADVLKAGHHGSDTSNTQDFVTTVDPQYVIISVGVDNKFGHPKETTLQTFANQEAELFRTDQDGNIDCRGSGAEITCE